MDKTKTLAKCLVDERITASDYAYNLSGVRIALEEAEYSITVDNTGEEDSAMIITYHSEHLRKAIVVGWDEYKDFKTLQELADYLNWYESIAQEIEESLTPATLRITIAGGVLQSVDGLPEGWTYELDDLDDEGAGG